MASRKMSQGSFAYRLDGGGIVLYKGSKHEGIRTIQKAILFEPGQTIRVTKVLKMRTSCHLKEKKSVSSRRWYALHMSGNDDHGI